MMSLKNVHPSISNSPTGSYILKTTVESIQDQFLCAWLLINSFPYDKGIGEGLQIINVFLLKCYLGCAATYILFCCMPKLVLNCPTARFFMETSPSLSHNKKRILTVLKIFGKIHHQVFIIFDSCFGFHVSFVIYVSGLVATKI